MQVTEELKLPDDGYYEYRNPEETYANALIPTTQPNSEATEHTTKNNSQLIDLQCKEFDGMPIGRTIRQTLDRLKRLSALNEKCPNNKTIADAWHIARTNFLSFGDIEDCDYPDINVSVRISKKKRFPMNRRG